MIKLGFIPPYHLARESLYFQTKMICLCEKTFQAIMTRTRKRFSEKTNSCVYK